MTELWTPMAFTAKEAENHGGHYVAAIGKLKPGVTLDQASTEMSTIAGRLAAQFPEANTGWNVKIIPLLSTRSEPSNLPCSSSSLQSPLSC